MAVNAKNWQELKKPSSLEKKASGGEGRTPLCGIGVTSRIEVIVKPTA